VFQIKDYNPNVVQPLIDYPQNKSTEQHVLLIQNLGAYIVYSVISKTLFTHFRIPLAMWEIDGPSI
jgi:hypothetical protein